MPSTLPSNNEFHPSFLFSFPLGTRNTAAQHRLHPQHAQPPSRRPARNEDPQLMAHPPRLAITTVVKTWTTSRMAEGTRTEKQERGMYARHASHEIFQAGLGRTENGGVSAAISPTSAPISHPQPAFSYTTATATNTSGAGCGTRSCVL